MNFLIDYQKECPGCGETYQAKRLNQSFCTSTCKNRYHNGRSRQKKIVTQERQRITRQHDKILWTNRKLLKANVGETVALIDLENLGFKTNFITHFKNVGEQTTRFFCYDIAYEFLDTKTLKIF